MRVRLHLSERKNVKRLKECNIVGDMTYSQSGAIIRVYYPEPEETLFEIAKKFHTTVAKIASDNGIDESCIGSLDSSGESAVPERIILR